MTILRGEDPRCDFNGHFRTDHALCRHRCLRVDIRASARGNAGEISHERLQFDRYQRRRRTDNLTLSQLAPLRSPTRHDVLTERQCSPVEAAIDGTPQT